ncbi:MAG: hypothetical protein ABSA86_13415 [Oryzomonas sp.]|jgi:hypothetical protein
MRKLILILLLTCIPCQAKNKVAYFNVKEHDPKSTLEVVLDSKPEADYADKTKYKVVSLSSLWPGGRWKAIEIVEVKINGDNTVDITPADPSEIKQAAKLMLLVGNDPGVYNSSVPKPQTGLVKGTGKSSDVYVNLSYSPGISGPPQYSIDTSVGLLFQLPSETTRDYGALGFLGAVKTDKRPTADPDSYRFFGVYQHVLTHKAYWPLQGVLFTWLAGGSEFERKANNINFISSPLLDFPIRLRGRIDNNKQVVPVLIPEIGMEIGDNFMNAVNPNGQGAIARGVLGGNLTVSFDPKMKQLQSIHLMSSYKLRLPARAEVFTNTMTNASGTTVDVPFLTTKPRHYIKNELDFTLWDPISLSVTHQYGDIPPAFRLVDHTVTIGLTLALQHKSQLESGFAGK